MTIIRWLLLLLVLLIAGGAINRRLQTPREEAAYALPIPGRIRTRVTDPLGASGEHTGSEPQVSCSTPITDPLRSGSEGSATPTDCDPPPSRPRCPVH